MPLNRAPVFAAAAAATFACNPATDTIKVVGDSETAGGIVGPGGTSTPWQVNLAADLGGVAQAGTIGAVGVLMSWFADPTNYTACTAGLPTILFLELSTNDVPATAPATTAANLKTGALGFWGILPGSRIVVLGPFNHGEQWPDGANASDANADATTAAMIQACNQLAAAGHPITFINVRANWFVEEASANPTNDGAGYYLTVDHLHLNATGAADMSQIVANYKL
jgi:lysophospholipase L1-like esterase